MSSFALSCIYQVLYLEKLGFGELFFCPPSRKALKKLSHIAMCLSYLSYFMLEKTILGGDFPISHL